MTLELEVVVWRGAIAESRHRTELAVASPDGALRMASAHPRTVTTFRSAAKPFQVLPLVERGHLDRWGFNEEQLAVMCASHSGSAYHIALVRGILERLGLDERAFACGYHEPQDPAMREFVIAHPDQRSGIWNNCSGKHAGMIALARHRGFPVSGYANPDHPIQRLVLTEVARWTGLKEAAVPHATDGCGVPSFALPLRAMALAWSRLGAALAGDRIANYPRESQQAAARLMESMRAEPFLIAGTARLDTELASAAAGRVIAKVGAEGVYCATIPEQRLGLALKVEDGATRCLNPALLGLLDVLLPGTVKDLDEQRRPGIRNTLGKDVGHIEARIVLDRAASR